MFLISLKSEGTDFVSPVKRNANIIRNVISAIYAIYREALLELYLSAKR